MSLKIQLTPAEVPPLGQCSFGEIAGAERIRLNEDDGAKIIVRTICANVPQIRHGLSALQKYHPETYDHSLRVAYLATDVGRHFLPADRLFVLSAGALAHDIGKLAVPLHILDKPGTLTDAERDVVNRHAEHSGSYLDAAGMKDAALLARHHHNLCADLSDPLTARSLKILVACDIADGTFQDRVYKKGWPVEKVFDSVREAIYMNEADGGDLSAVLSQTMRRLTA